MTDASRRYACWTDRPPQPHPWIPIPDAACGYDQRLTSPQCTGCHRQRPESPMDQLAARNALGAAARDQLARLANG